MRLQGFKCDRCGDINNHNDGVDFCKLSSVEVGQEFLAEFPEIRRLELCDDCYEEFRDLMRDTIDDFLGGCNTEPYDEDGRLKGEEE